jgi:hypothetical protein
MKGQVAQYMKTFKETVFGCVYQKSYINMFAECPHIAKKRSKHDNL